MATKQIGIRCPAPLVVDLDRLAKALDASPEWSAGRTSAATVSDAARAAIEIGLPILLARLAPPKEEKGAAKRSSKPRK